MIDLAKNSEIINIAKTATPNCNGVLTSGRLRLVPLTSAQVSAPSVNELFKSIADDAGSNAIGIVLSGTGSDGLKGCQAIKDRGGKVFIQDASSAAFDGMPGAVQRAGLVDKQLSPESLADAINELFPSPGGYPLPTGPTDQVIDTPGLSDLIDAVSQSSGVEFTSYKQETLLRRIQGRMKVLRVDDVQKYCARARTDPAELKILGQLFIVSLSWFFRDPVAFEKLRELMSAYLAISSGGDVVRAWVPGCATGEECYSMAILLTELVASLHLRKKVEVVGSDLNATALNVAKKGCYAARAFKELHVPQMISKYFVPDGELFRVSDRIREICSFRMEDVMRADPPKGLDLISCRNLLIYLNIELQEQLLSKFFQVLKPNGMLFLGMSENLGLMGATKFTSIDAGLRIFQRK